MDVNKVQYNSKSSNYNVYKTEPKKEFSPEVQQKTLKTEKAPPQEQSKKKSFLSKIFSGWGDKSSSKSRDKRFDSSDSLIE
mmetsp:Transcript_8328/g.7401  ORF Transcript_8328/g.7401 Transcript_8328/m.7401 type:complete len:81 (+) Transcript_8328:195-437(+)